MLICLKRNRELEMQFLCLIRSARGSHPAQHRLGINIRHRPYYTCGTDTDMRIMASFQWVCAFTLVPDRRWGGVMPKKSFAATFSMHHNTDDRLRRDSLTWNAMDSLNLFDNRHLIANSGIMITYNAYSRTMIIFQCSY